MSGRAWGIFLALTLSAPALFAQQGEFGRSRRMLGDPNEFYVPPEFKGRADLFAQTHRYGLYHAGNCCFSACSFGRSL